jgi:phenylpropionate dioxygenase-like ring-hydroxylating dioxygenase large terminal subunit
VTVAAGGGRLRAAIGWYEVAMPHDVVPGQVLARRYFDTPLVLWRAPDGAITCQEAYCPHAGADMAVGARLVDGCIECPFHAWRFDADGWNRRLFMGGRGAGARLRTYPVRVVAGIVFAWHHPYGEPPTWDLLDVPELADPRYRRTDEHERTIDPDPVPGVAVARSADRTVLTTCTPIDAGTSRVSHHVAVRHAPD